MATRIGRDARHFGRVLVSVYGLDRDEYRTMVMRDDYELMVAQLARIAALAKPGTVNVGLRLLKNRTMRRSPPGHPMLRGAPG